MDAGEGHDKPAENKNDDEDNEEARGDGPSEMKQKHKREGGTPSMEGAAARRRKRYRASVPEVQTQKQMKYRWSYRREKTGRTGGKYHGACTLSSADPLRKNTRAAPPELLQQNSLKRSTKATSLEQ